MAQPTIEASTQQQPRPNLRPKVGSTGIFVLIVEDNHINRIVCLKVLERQGHTVATVGNGQEALDFLCKTSGNRQPNLVFMDTSMPVMDGYEATRRIRRDAGMFDERMRTVPIIGLTANALRGVREQILEAGMDDYIAAPIRPRDLQVAVMRWISPKGP
ncbi:CheY-like protein [Paraphaeosphaeria sporulosa]|uniref:CheY-like protein n=1 Tax=Paraphaeosphaeria sporulosa TaxID=1460663 RepID=A0A177CX07_9PLEO|nr:CheY-like protein [Paraphaeosphaeria sporulosa]OAG12085.1 CheY-like protein [Paraphaeosphaeria sporulosa]